MAFEYIKPDALLKTFNDAKKFMTPLHAPFDEFERISRNKPHPGIDKNLPRVTDGTLASIIKEKPKRVIQQIPTGIIECEDDWLELVAQYILTHEILPNASEQAEFIRKCKLAVSKSMTYGSQPAFVKFVNNGEYFGTDFQLPYIKDIFLEPGKVSDRDSKVIFLSTWWSEADINALIAKETKLSKSAKGRGDDYAGWDVKKLKDLLETNTSQKPQQQQTQAERGKQLNNGFFQIVHAFQVGVGANFYSFAPKLTDGSNVLRTKKNPDPRGVIPIHFMYADEDLSNPLGIGAVEMSGGMQNLLDSEVQMYQYNRALMLNPPMKKWGAWSKANAKFVPNHIIEMGSKVAGDDIEPLAVDNSALQNFPQNYGLMKSQILNLNNSLDTSVSATVGNPGFSKTDAGVNAQSERLGISDNDMRKSFESWFGRVAETMVNLYFAERSGVQELTVDDETAYKLKKIRPDAVSKDNKIRIDYDTETPILKFKVDASSSDMKENAQQLEALDGLLERYEKAPILQQIIPPDKIVGMWNSMISASGVEDPEKLSIETGPDGQIKQDENAQQQQPQMSPEMVQQMIQQGIQESKANDPNEHPMIKLMASLNIKFPDLDSDTQRQLIQEIFGIQSSAPLPSEITQATQVADTHLKADAQAHSQAMDAAKLTNDHSTTLHDQSVKMLEMAHTQDQQAQDNQMGQAQFSHTVDQADKSHELAQQTAKQQADKPKAGATK